MKKLLAIIVTLLVVITMLAGCGNESLGFGNFTFKKIHIDTYHYSGCLTVEKWHDNSTGIEVLTKEAGSIYVSEGMYILMEGNQVCPFCEDHQ